MGNIFEGVFAVIIVIIVFFGFIFFLELMSKFSNKRIVQKGSRNTLVKPDDFDESVKLFKKVTEDLDFSIRKLKLNNFEQVIYKFDKILRKNASLTFSSYLYVKNQFETLVENIVSEGRISEKELYERLNNRGPTGLFYDGIIDNITYNKILILHTKLRVELASFSQSDMKKISRFMLPVLDSDDSKLINLLDAIGRENFKDFASVIDILEEMYLKNKVNKEEIQNIKLLILKRTGIIEVLI